jgi:hypothetical protein
MAAIIVSRATARFGIARRRDKEEKRHGIAGPAT